MANRFLRKATGMKSAEIEIPWETKNGRMDVLLEFVVRASLPLIIPL